MISKASFYNRGPWWLTSSWMVQTSENKRFKEKQVILHKLFCKLFQVLYCLHHINGVESLCVNLPVVTVMNTQGWTLMKTWGLISPQFWDWKILELCQLMVVADGVSVREAPCDHTGSWARGEACSDFCLGPTCQRHHLNIATLRTKVLAHRPWKEIDKPCPRYSCIYLVSPFLHKPNLEPFMPRVPITVHFNCSCLHHYSKNSKRP